MLLAGYQFLTLRASLISNRVGELQADFNSARRLITSKEKALGAAITGARFCAAHPLAVGEIVASAVSAVTGQTVQVVVYNSGLTQEAVAPAGASPPTLDSATLEGVVSRGTRCLLYTSRCV